MARVKKILEMFVELDDDEKTVAYVDCCNDGVTITGLSRDLSSDEAEAVRKVYLAAEAEARR